MQRISRGRHHSGSRFRGLRAFWPRKLPYPKTPAKAGVQFFLRWIPAFVGIYGGGGSLVQGVVEVGPFGIVAFDQLQLPSALPCLDLVFPCLRALAGIVRLIPDEPGHAIPAREDGASAFLVGPDARAQIVCVPRIEGAVALAGKDVDVEGHCGMGDLGPGGVKLYSGGIFIRRPLREQGSSLP